MNLFELIYKIAFDISGYVETLPVPMQVVLTIITFIAVGEMLKKTVSIYTDLFKSFRS
jgi:hypothetical protein